MTVRRPLFALAFLAALALSSVACETTVPPQATASPVASASGDPRPADPTSSSDPVPLQPLAGSWAGSVAVANDDRTRVTLSLQQCEVGAECGEIALRREDGVGCPYLVERYGPNLGKYPTVSLTPAADELVYYAINVGSVDCDGSWLADAILFIRAAPGGGIEVSHVVDLERDPVFRLDPAGAPFPTTGARAEIDRTSLIPGEDVAIAIAGFSDAVAITLWPDAGDIVDLGMVEVDAGGSASAVLRVPPGTPAGSYTLWIEGWDRDSREAGVPIRVTVVAGTSSGFLSRRLAQSGFQIPS